MLGPGRTSTWPAGVSVVRWSPYTSSTCGSSSTPAAIIGSAPPIISSAGWKMKTAVPATSRAARGQDLGHRDGDRRMPVVPARVHHARRPRRERRLEPLGERQRVDVGPPGDGAAGAIPVQDADDAGARDARPHLELGAVQALGDDLGRAPLLERQLGMAVEVPPEGDQPVPPLVHFLRPLEACLAHAAEGSLLGLRVPPQGDEGEPGQAGQPRGEIRGGHTRRSEIQPTRNARMGKEPPKISV